MLINGLDQLTAGRNELQEKINNVNFQQNSHDSLLSRIDTWQEQTIQKVKQAADQARQQALTFIRSKQDEIKKQFQTLSQELEQLQETEGVLEDDLSRLKNQIEQVDQCLEKLSQPSALELNTKQSEQIVWNRMIYVENRSTSFIPKQCQPLLQGECFD